MFGWLCLPNSLSLFFFSIYLFRLCQALDVACGIFTCACQILDCKQLTLSETENKCLGYQVAKNLQENFERKSDIVALCLLFGHPDLPSPFLPPAVPRRLTHMGQLNVFSGSGMRSEGGWCVWTWYLFSGPFHARSSQVACVPHSRPQLLPGSLSTHCLWTLKTACLPSPLHA